MSYSALADVQAEFKNIIFDSVGNITDSKVNAFIAQVDSIIEANVGMRYQTPVVGGSQALALLKSISVTMVADKVRSIMSVKQVTSGKDANQSTRGPGMLSTKDCMQMLQDIREGKLLLRDAVPLQVQNGMVSGNVQNNVCPVVRKNERQW